MRGWAFLRGWVDGYYLCLRLGCSLGLLIIMVGVKCSSKRGVGEGRVFFVFSEIVWRVRGSYKDLVFKGRGIVFREERRVCVK